MTGNEDAVIQDFAMTPRQAIEVVQATGVEDPAKLIRDHTAAGLIRSYAHAQLTIEADGMRTTRLGAGIATELWERMICEGVDGDIWGGGTVRLSGSELDGGAPAIHITGIAFHPADIQRLALQQRATPQPTWLSKRASPLPPPSPLPPSEPSDTIPPLQKARRAAPNLSALHSGALHLTVEQTMAALAISHTTLYKLLKLGELDRAPSTAGTRITVASVRKYAGLAD